ncbi:MAG: substrate-binding domain-containing protein [Tepidisphaeraceae bacterium]
MIDLPANNSPAIEPRSHLKYERLKRLLLDQMSSGQLRPGDLLPPEVDLAQKMGVARNTVRQAMRELELQRLIRRVRGKGTIVCEVAPPAVAGSTSATTAAQLFGLVLPELRTGMYLSLQAGLNDAMSRTGSNMIVCDSRQDVFQQVDALLQLAHRGVAGIAMVPITPSPTPLHHVAFMRQCRLPLVFCHRRIPGISAPLVGFSSYDMGYTAGVAMAKAGHRRVAAIFSHMSDTAAERKRGVRDAIIEAGGQLPEEFVYADTQLRADSVPPGLEDRLERELKRMLAHPRPPTAFIVSADQLAAVTCVALQRLGRTVPKDASVIGFGDRSNRDIVLPCKLQSVTVDEWKLGQIAFDTLGQILRNQRPLDDNEEILMPLEVSEGGSIAPPPAK